MCVYAAERNDVLACCGASDSRVLFANIVRNIEKRDTTLLFVFVNRYYDDSRLIHHMCNNHIIIVINWS